MAALPLFALFAVLFGVNFASGCTVCFTKGVAAAAAALGVVGALAATPLAAQQVDSVRVGPPASDTTRRPARSLAPLQPPPISPGRAFLYSVLVPGLGQAKLDRHYVGAGFFMVEVLALSIASRTAADLRSARAFQGDSVPLTYAVDATTGQVKIGAKGLPEVATWQKNGYGAALVKVRKLQYEDWVALVIFNHLVSAADAFVASQLWDLPQHLKLRTAPLARGGMGAAFSYEFR